MRVADIALPGGFVSTVVRIGGTVRRTMPGNAAFVHRLLDFAGLVREFHDLTAGSTLAGDAEVVCHNDLSPKNTVYRDPGTGLRPVAFID